MSAEVPVGRAGLPLCRSGQRWRPAHLCGEVIPALQTPPKQKALWSAERGGGGVVEEGRAAGGRERRRRAGGRGVGGGGVEGEAALPFHREVPGGQHGA